MNDQYETLKSGLSSIIVGNQPFILQTWKTTEADRLLAKELIEKYSKEKEVSDDTWSKQFYKALETVGKLTEVEKIRLANILIAVSDIEEKHNIVDPTTLRHLRGVEHFVHTLTVEQLPKHTNGAELYKDKDCQPVKSETLGEIKSPPKKP